MNNIKKSADSSLSVFWENMQNNMNTYYLVKSEIQITITNNISHKKKRIIDMFLS